MTKRNKATLTALFEQADIPTGANFADWIDSCVNEAETSGQTLLSPLTVTELVTPKVSASTINATNNFTAVSATFTGDVTVSGTMFPAGGLNTTATLFTGGLQCNGDVSAANVHTSAFSLTSRVVSAAGSAQATATTINHSIIRCAGVSANQKTGFLLAGVSGKIQYVYNDVASANLWPPTDGRINALATNAAFPMAASTLYTVVHLTTSAFAVK